MEWIDHLLIVIFGLLLPWRSLQNARKGELAKMTFDTHSKRVLYYSNGMVLWLMTTVILFTWLFTGRDMGLLGLQWGQLPFANEAWWILLTFVVLYGSDVLIEIVTPEKQAVTRQKMRKTIGFLPENSYEFAHYVFLAVTAGVCEEIIFRGYFIRYAQWLLEDQGGRFAIAFVLLLPAVSFGVAHLYQGWKAVLKIVVMAVLFGVFFLITGTIWPLILIHIVVDLIGGLVSWYLLSTKGR